MSQYTIFVPMDGHEQYMEKCLALASRAAEEGESRVGSLIVKDRQIIGEAAEVVYRQ